MSNALKKEDKIDIRVSSDVKKILNQAASLYETSLSEFVIQSALRMARTVLSESQDIKLSTPEWNTLMEAMERPARKHARLAKLFAE